MTTKGAIANEPPIIIPEGYRILVRLKAPERKSKGGIIYSDATVEHQEFMMYLGQVVAMGSLCYRHKKFEGGTPWCQVGDWIAFGQVAGQNIETIHGEKYKLINDDNVMGRAPAPELLKVFV